jgi:arylsulfatase A-like enzyme
LQARPEDIARYRTRYTSGWDALRNERLARMKRLRLVSRGTHLSPRSKYTNHGETVTAENPAWSSLAEDRRADLAMRMALYAAMIDRMDQDLGRVTADLRASGELDDTLILFLSDNGGNAEGGPPGVTDGEGPIGGPRSYVKLGMNWATLANTPFGRYKHFTHEGGISTPLIAHWPAGIPATRRNALEKQPVHLIDIMATAVDLAGAHYPHQRDGQAIEPMQGVSLRPTFDGQRLARTQPLFWEHEGNKAVRDGKWKLVLRHRQPWQLFDMEADRTEQHDLIGQHPEVAARLEAAWDDWARRSYVDEWPGPDHTDWGQDIERR